VREQVVKLSCPNRLNLAHDLIRGQVPFALAMADLDHFRALNDMHGHDAATKPLRVFYQMLRTSLRETISLVGCSGGS
jgi:diguanylate cyclase (GGDEF)-like protein